MDSCNLTQLPSQSDLWGASRRFDIGASGNASSPCSAFLNNILLENPSASETSTCGGTADADVSFHANYEAIGLGQSAIVSLGHGAFHIPQLDGGFSRDCCDSANPCAFAYTGSQTIEPITGSIEFSICRPTKVVVDVDLVILDCDSNTFDYFAAWFSLTGVGTVPLEQCIDGYRKYLWLQPGTYTLEAAFDYVITTGRYRDCTREIGEETSKPLILLDASVRAMPALPQPGVGK